MPVHVPANIVYGQTPQASISSNRSATFTSPSPSKSAAHVSGAATQSSHEPPSPSQVPFLSSQRVAVIVMQPVPTQQAPRGAVSSKLSSAGELVSPTGR